LLCVNFNFENSTFPIVSRVFNGKYPDFSTDWYKTIGPILTRTLIIIGLMPIFDCFYAIAIKRWIQYQDYGRFFINKNAKIETNCKTVA